MIIILIYLLKVNPPPDQQEKQYHGLKLILEFVHSHWINGLQSLSIAFYLRSAWERESVWLWERRWERERVISSTKRAFYIVLTHPPCFLFSLGLRCQIRELWPYTIYFCLDLGGVGLGKCYSEGCMGEYTISYSTKAIANKALEQET